MYFCTLGSKSHLYSSFQCSSLSTVLYICASLRIAVSSQAIVGSSSLHCIDAVGWVTGMASAVQIPENQAG